jgi:hypothetical protein
MATTTKTVEQRSTSSLQGVPDDAAVLALQDYFRGDGYGGFPDEETCRSALIFLNRLKPRTGRLAHEFGEITVTVENRRRFIVFRLRGSELNWLAGTLKRSVAVNTGPRPNDKSIFDLLLGYLDNEVTAEELLKLEMQRIFASE